MYELPTVEGKVVKITSAIITISKNERCQNGYAISFNLIGVLPQCRKNEVLTQSFSYHGHITLTTLFGYRKHHSIDPEEYRKLIKSAPVTSPSYYGQVDVTPELEALARAYAEEVCDCVAVKGKPNELF
jgi:hypothetical protein